MSISEPKMIRFISSSLVKVSKVIPRKIPFLRNVPPQVRPDKLGLEKCAAPKQIE
jgi:hypothetical protein